MGLLRSVMEHIQIIIGKPQTKEGSLTIPIHGIRLVLCFIYLHHAILNLNICFVARDVIPWVKICMIMPSGVK